MSLLEGGFFGQHLGRLVIAGVQRKLGASDAPPDGLRSQISLLEHEKAVAAAAETIESLPESQWSWRSLEELRTRLCKAGADYLRAKRTRELGSLLSYNAHRTQLAHFRTALRASDSRRKAELLAKVPVGILLRAFPCWASTDRFLSHILPLKPRLFDLVVIDEASQCDQASAAPSLYRGRRAVIVGDPKQLRHVTFLSRKLEHAAFFRYGIPSSAQLTYSYRRSLFDVASDNVAHGANFMLDEHFRSLPPIIRFPAARFYPDSLRLMTQRPEAEVPGSLRVVYVDGLRESVKGPNVREARRAVEEIRNLMSGAPDWSLALLSPFRVQVNLLKMMVAETFTPQEIEQHRLVVGTAHVLQGDERDAVVISFVLDRHFHHNQLRWLEQETGVFNVSVTRARRELVVLSSARPPDLPTGLLKEFLVYCESQARPAEKQDTFDSAFEEECV